MSDKPNQLLDKVTRAICAEDCAFRGEPPCWEICPDEWPNPNCDEPGCRWHAIVALAVMMEEMERRAQPQMKQSDPFVVYGENMILWLQPEPGNYDFTLSVLGGGRQTANGKIKLRAEHLAELSEHLSELARHVADQKEKSAA